VELLTLTRVEEIDFPDLSRRGTAWFTKLVKVKDPDYLESR
jgi:hypothetical protein